MPKQPFIVTLLTMFSLAVATYGFSDNQPVTKPNTTETIAQLQQEIDALTGHLLSMQEQLEQLKVEQEKRQLQQEIEQLRSEARAAANESAGSQVEIDTATDFVSGTRMQSQFNPELSVTGDVWLVGGEHIREQVQMQHFELDLRSYLDPYSLMVVVLGFGGDHLHDEYGAVEEHHDHHDVEVEEGYISWFNLPGNLSLTLGKKRQQFGVLNRYHAHALDQADRPWILTESFGDHGLSGTGISANWLMPGLWADVTELTIEITNGDNETAFGGEDWQKPTMLARLKSYWDLNVDSYVEIGLNALHGSADHDGDLSSDFLALDIAYNWNPADRQLYRDITVRAMILRADRDLRIGQSVESWGGFVYGQYKFAHSWIAGIRFDSVEDQLDIDHDYWGITPYLTFWQSEFVRFRAQMSYRDDTLFGVDRRLLIQTTLSAGPHKHDTY